MKTRILGPLLLLLLLWRTVPESIADSAVPDLRLTSELAWDNVFESDPLRIIVVLSSPVQQADVLRQIQLREQGQTNLTPVAIRFAVSNQWATNLVFTLSKVAADGGLSPVLPTESWRTFLRPNLSDQARWRLLHRTTDWLAPPDQPFLPAGRYLLQVAWNGRGMGVDGSLPSDGVLHAADLSFEVSVPTNQVQQAAHLSRLAFQEFFKGDFALARQHGQAALHLDSANFTPDGLDTYALVGSASVRLQDYYGAAQVYQDLINRLPTRNCETARAAFQRFAGLAPELMIRRAANTSAQPRVILLATPHQQYRVDYSSDLFNWTTLCTNALQTNWADLPATPAGSNRRFYRALWMP